MADFGMTKEEGIKKAMGGGGHVVILGAGASIASTKRNEEKKGKQLPSMDNFIEIVGLQDIVETIQPHLRANNFETLYSNLHNENPESVEIQEIERRVNDYFKEMELPDEPTIYDYLVLSLRSKDLIATFNWDPFLYQAWCRHNIGEKPYVAFLHGNIAIGYSKRDKRCGPSSAIYGRRGVLNFEPTKLLYPVTKKNYNKDEFIKAEWDRVKLWLSKESSTVRVTIFGYGAPATDIEAMQLMNGAWGTPNDRNMEQFEIIDIRPESDLKKTWENFIHSHHYDYGTSYFDSVLAHYPRRTSESYFHHYQASTPSEMFQESNPVPQDFKTLDEMREWFKPLIEAEELEKK